MNRVEYENIIFLLFHNNNSNKNNNNKHKLTSFYELSHWFVYLWYKKETMLLEISIYEFWEVPKIDFIVLTVNEFPSVRKCITNKMQLGKSSYPTLLLLV